MQLKRTKTETDKTQVKNIIMMNIEKHATIRVEMKIFGLWESI